MSGPGSINNMPAASGAFSNFVQSYPAAAATALKTKDGQMITANFGTVQRLYLSSRGELKQSSNAISHAFRKLVGKPVGEAALMSALERQAGAEGLRLLENLSEPAGNLTSLRDIDRVLNKEETATWNPEMPAFMHGTNKAGEGVSVELTLEVEDFTPDDQVAANLWNKFNRTNMADAEAGNREKDGFHRGPQGGAEVPVDIEGLPVENLVQGGVQIVRAFPAGLEQEDPLDLAGTTDALNRMFEPPPAGTDFTTNVLEPSAPEKAEPTKVEPNKPEPNKPEPPKAEANKARQDENLRKMWNY